MSVEPSRSTSPDPASREAFSTRPSSVPEVGRGRSNDGSLLGDENQAIIDPWATIPSAPPTFIQSARRVSLWVYVFGGLAIAVSAVGGVFACSYAGLTDRRLSEKALELVGLGPEKEAKTEEPGAAHDEVAPRRGAFPDQQVMPAPLHTPKVTPHQPLPDNGTVPADTSRREVGKVPVVEMGTNEPSLKRALSTQARQARAQHKKVMVMVTEGVVKNAEDFLKSIPEPSMQEALESVVVVVIDRQVFEQELNGLGMQTTGWPSFFLLGADGDPTDSITGGEWGDDIAANIAPVINPFVRGEYIARKAPKWKLPAPSPHHRDPGGSISL